MGRWQKGRVVGRKAWWGSAKKFSIQVYIGKGIAAGRIAVKGM